MHRGYVKLWRKSLDSPVWKNPNLWRFWSWCLLKASHRETAELAGYQCVQLNPGQFLFGRKVASQETGLSERSIRTSLHSLEKLGKLTIEPTNKFSVLTIVKWEDYQHCDQQATTKMTSKRPASDQQATTFKNDKNVKKKEESPTDSCSGRSVPNAKSPYSESFEMFWKAYPPTRKGSKYKASVAWKKIGQSKLTKFQTIMDALTRQIDAAHFVNNKGEDFTPNAVTWLNGRRWEDDISGAAVHKEKTWEELLGKEDDQ